MDKSCFYKNNDVVVVTCVTCLLVYLLLRVGFEPTQSMTTRNLTSFFGEAYSHLSLAP